MLSSSSTSCKVNLLYLPDDLLLNCLARVSRLYYPTLSLVSKRFRSLLASTEIYQTRTLLGCTESCIYARLRLDCKYRWFTLCRRPTQIPNPNPKPKPNSPWFMKLMNGNRKKEKKNNSSENTLISIPTRNFSPPLSWNSDLVAVGFNIYKFGGNINRMPSSRVFIMDCRSHTWHEAPSMQIAWGNPKVSVLDGKIYVVEAYQDFDSSKNLIECFDLKTETWDEHLPRLDEKMHTRCQTNNLAIEGKLYFFGDYDKALVYEPKENKWDVVGWEKCLVGPQVSIPVFLNACCVIENVVYSCRVSKVLEWYDIKVRSWKVLKGLKELPKLPTGGVYVRLMNYDGKIAVLWEENDVSVFSSKTMIWCAVISLERCNGKEICGKVEWCDVVLRARDLSHCFDFLAVTL